MGVTRLPVEARVFVELDQGDVGAHVDDARRGHAAVASKREFEVGVTVDAPGERARPAVGVAEAQLRAVAADAVGRGEGASRREEHRGAVGELSDGEERGAVVGEAAEAHVGVTARTCASCR